MSHDPDHQLHKRDPALEAAIRDPAQVTSHEQILLFIGMLDLEIASIESQLEMARAEAAIAPLTNYRQDWMRRAAYARSMRWNQRHRLHQRDKELRGVKGPAQTPPKDPAEGQAKMARFQAEVEARRAAKLAETAKHNARAAEFLAMQGWRRHFIDVVRDSLTAEQFTAFVLEAKRRNQNAQASTAVEIAI